MKYIDSDSALEHKEHILQDFLKMEKASSELFGIMDEALEQFNVLNDAKSLK
jgi:hypothetical protein